MGAKIAQIEYYLPEKVLNNEELASLNPGWSAAKIETKVGIRNRHIAASDESSMDLAIKAGQKLLSFYDADAIDFLIFCTQSPEYLLPTSACIIQDQLGLRTNVGALDFNLGCSGYIYGLAMAKALIESRIATNVLLLTGETYSKFIIDSDISNKSIFGDAATATLVTWSEHDQIGEFVFGTDGAGAENLIVKNIGAKNHYTCPEGVQPELYMDGPEIFNFTIETIPKLVRDVCSKNGLGLSNVSYTILHQANKYILEFLTKTIGLEPEKVHIDLWEYGNTVSNTIPIALKDCLDKNIVKPQNNVLLAGFGVGYSWGAVVLNL
jgi:3-oxoacyl-[acyl-carrier-protein] synthase-3